MKLDHKAFVFIRESREKRILFTTITSQLKKQGYTQARGGVLGSHDVRIFFTRLMKAHQIKNTSSELAPEAATVGVDAQTTALMALKEILNSNLSAYTKAMTVEMIINQSR